MRSWQSRQACARGADAAKLPVGLDAQISHTVRSKPRPPKDSEKPKLNTVRHIGGLRIEFGNPTRCRFQLDSGGVFVRILYALHSAQVLSRTLLEPICCQTASVFLGPNCQDNKPTVNWHRLLADPTSSVVLPLSSSLPAKTAGLVGPGGGQTHKRLKIHMRPP